MRKRRAERRTVTVALCAITVLVCSGATAGASTEDSALVRVSIQLRSAVTGTVVRITLDGEEIYARAVPPVMPSPGESGPPFEKVGERDFKPGSRHVLIASVPSARAQARLSWALASKAQWIVVYYDPAATAQAAPTIGFSIQDAAAANK